MLDVEKVDVTVIVENAVMGPFMGDSDFVKRYQGLGNLLAESGLSMLVECWSESGVKTSILMDTGRAPKVFENNLEQLKLDFGEVNSLVISHGHHDHTGANTQVLDRIGHSTTVITHPDTFLQRFMLMKTGRLRNIGVNPSQSLVELEKHGGNVALAKNSIPLGPGILTSGEIERTTDFEESKVFYRVKNNQFEQDPLLDDQALIINVKDKGLAILLGCGHSGVINTIRHAQKITGIKEIYAVLGGFHLIQASEDRLKRTLDELVKLNLKVLAPFHCTGLNATSEMLRKIPTCFQYVTTGSVIKL